MLFFFLMIRRPPRSTLDRSSAASDVYKRQAQYIEGRSLANYGTIYVSGAIRLSSIIENTGSIVTATLQVSTGLETHGTITCSDSLITGLPGLGSAEISKIFGGALVETNVFFNPEPCLSLIHI